MFITTFPTPLMQRLFCCLLMMMLLLWMPAAQAEKRVALVIGNAAYDGDARLINPVGDAQQVAAALRALKFEVFTPTLDHAIFQDLDRESLLKAFIDFGKLAKTADVMFVYYSGHGMRGPKGDNYLVPVKSTITTDDHIKLRAVALNDVLQEIGSDERQLRIVVLDACRNNPFGDRVRGDGTKGLSLPDSQAGTLLAFATGEGKTALDNSPYAKALAKHLTQSGLDIKEVFDQVAMDVYKATGQAQRPMKVDDVLGKHYLAGQATTTTTTSTTTTLSMAITPAPVPTQRVNLDRLKAEETRRQQWAQSQQNMKADFDKIAAFAGSADLKANAWEQFLDSWATDNPLSDEDESLRAQANAQLQAAQEAHRQAQAQRPGQTLPKDCPQCPEMVVIGAGSFLMGSNDGDPDEKSPHNVNVPGFAAGKFAVTRGEFAAFVQAQAKNYKTDAEKGDGCYGYSGGNWTKNKSYNWRNPGFNQTDRHPVVCVSWNDAKAYAEWVSQVSGKPYRLLTEAEREYAARARSTSAYWWGDKASHEYANYGKDECCGGLAQGRDQWVNTAPVGQFPANPFGLFDMHGNVWEWVEDVKHDNYNGAPINGSAWLSGGDQTSRVLRGGSWGDNPRGLRSAGRLQYTADSSGSIAGFRLARTLLTP